VKEPKNLADRYRRLLAWYPRDHRERHGEEMLGVLLAGAGERTRPSRRETVDVLRGALRLHLRRVVGADGGIDHRDVLAIVSLLGPIALLAGAAPIAEILARWVRTGSMESLQVFLSYMPTAPGWIVWIVVAVLSLFRARRAAAVGAWLGTFGFVLVYLREFSLYLDRVLAEAGPILLGLVVASALTWSPGPARGWELVGGRRVAVLVAAVGVSVVLVMKSLGTFSVLSMPVEHMTLVQGPGRMTLWFLALAVLVAGAVLASGARTREGRRAALVLSVPVVVTVLMLVLPRDSDRLLVAAIGYGVPVVALLGFGSLPRRVRLG
jgi:hypothetical protein